MELKKCQKKITAGPYEKVIENGASTLTDAQLLAVILRTGTPGEDATQLADKVFAACKNENSLVGLCEMSLQELMEIKGIGKVKAIQIQCIVEITKRLSRRSAMERMDYSSPEKIAQYYMQDMMHLDKERVILVLLDGKLKLIKDIILSIGSVNASLVTPREIFVEALKYRATSFVLLHNHPSGDPTPSRSDIVLSERIHRSSAIIGINFVDHIVIGNMKYVSFREKGLIDN